MFQRQARQSFPTRNIFVLAAAVIGLLVFMLKKTKEEPAQNQNQINIEMRDTTLPQEQR